MRGGAIITITGLIFCLIGALSLGLWVPRVAKFSTGPILPLYSVDKYEDKWYGKHVNLIFWCSWGAIILGFILQIIGTCLA